MLGDDPALKVFAGLGLSLVVLALMNTGLVTMPNVSTFDDLLGILLPMFWLLLLTPTLIVGVVHGARWRRKYEPVRSSEVRASDCVPHQVRSTKARIAELKRRSKELISHFQLLDTSGDGYVSVEELAHAWKVPEEEAKIHFNKMDTDGDGKISLAEFLAAGGLTPALKDELDQLEEEMKRAIDASWLDAPEKAIDPSWLPWIREQRRGGRSEDELREMLLDTLPPSAGREAKVEALLRGQLL